MSDKIQQILRLYRCVYKRIPSKNRTPLFRTFFEETSFKDLSPKALNTYVSDFVTYVNAVHDCHELYEIYGIGIVRDEKRSVENITHKVGLRLPELYQEDKQ